ncbi:Transcription termination factor like [Quillaja saponaria]|uniref:Transcription termination factor like n=1 Tax=Quillaja saponaria TaxID=32244 RepID=A0AAD7VLJ8_QUISA|nr:Transcription termination factor like [Quillaja saponaria]
MFDYYREVFHHLKGCISVTTSPTHQLHFLLHQRSPSTSTFSVKYGTSTSNSQSFTVSYLMKNCGVSPETALSASKRVNFETSEKPDSVLAFFTSYGFSNTQIYHTIKFFPGFLVANPVKTLKPKLEFFSFKSLLQSDKRTITSIKRATYVSCYRSLAINIKLFRDNGVPDSKIALLLFNQPNSLNRGLDCTKEVVAEVKEMGFCPSKSAFVVAVRVKLGMNKSTWQRNFGWSDEATLAAFQKHPCCMSVSEDKIITVMDIFVNQLGLDSMVLSKKPYILSLSLKKRIMPRVAVLQYLLARALLCNESDALARLPVQSQMPSMEFICSSWMYCNRETVDEV